MVSALASDSAMALEAPPVVSALASDSALALEAPPVVSALALDLALALAAPPLVLESALALATPPVLSTLTLALALALALELNIVSDFSSLVLGEFRVLSGSVGGSLNAPGESPLEPSSASFISCSCEAVPGSLLFI